MTTLPRALRTLDPVQVDGLLRLVDEIGASRPVISSREERAQRRALTARLEAAAVPDSSAVASLLVEAGVDGDPTPLLPLLRHPGAREVLDLADSLAALQRSTATVSVAAARAAKIVSALKRYAHPGDVSGAPVQAAIVDHLDTVLTLYGHQLKRGVEVVREVHTPGVVEARHEALNQVWTNLVHNALQAMEGEGTLVVRVRQDGPDFVRVDVVDDGPGLPPEVAARAFEPFFTTKPVGEGSGLGLSISRDIVESHGGTLSVDSEPGRTCFSVRLPTRAPPPPAGRGGRGRPMG